MQCVIHITTQYINISLWIVKIQLILLYILLSFKIITQFKTKSVKVQKNE